METFPYLGKIEYLFTLAEAHLNFRKQKMSRTD